MIILDTQIWIWWVDNNAKLNQRQRELINTYQSSGGMERILSCPDPLTKCCLFMSDYLD